ncbi:MAG: sortase [bacterium]|nr:sortase [bacterium]
MIVIKKIKPFLRAFIFFFVICFLIINWNNISWIFNYKAVSQILSEKFLPKEKINYEYSAFQNILEIPNLEISAPIVFLDEKNSDLVYKSLDFGVVHFPDSKFPGQTGQTIILGHSAPIGWPKIKYDWIFSRINELEQGDKIFIHYNSKKFSYSVNRKIFLERGEEIPENGLTKNKNVLILISCWPPGKDLKRIAIEAQN